jgi:hypothetical protein
MPGMPYHLEKGPWLTVLEDYLNGQPGRSVDALQQLRQSQATGSPLADLAWLASPALDGDPDYETLEKRRLHLTTDWFGTDDGRPHSFVDAVWHRLSPTVQRSLETAHAVPPAFPDRAEEIVRFAEAAVDATSGHLPEWPATGFWFQYHGDVEGVVREMLIRAIEASLGLDHGHEPPADGPDRVLPIELFWKCPQRWFEGWVSWRWDAQYGTGQVTAMLATPGSGKPILENLELGDGAIRAESTRANANGPVPQGPGPSDPARNGGQSAKGMWVISHREHAQLPMRPADAGTPSGQWLIPEFGPAYVGVGPIVCVQPSEADGGVKPFGRPYRELALAHPTSADPGALASTE